MEDFERYGDYNDIDDGGERKRSIAIFIVKLLTAVVCLGVVGILVFRMIVFSYYPDGVKRIVFNDELIQYYNDCGGEIGAKTQDIRFPYDNYDDPDDEYSSYVVGNFFVDNLIIIEGAGQIQFSLRYNASAMMDIAERYEMEEPPSADDGELLTFRLYDNYGRVYDSLIYCERYSFMMYRYYKLAFDGIELSDTGDGKYPEWISLEIFVGDNEKPYSYIVFYENNEDFSIFSDYKLSDAERKLASTDGEE